MLEDNIWYLAIYLLIETKMIRTLLRPWYNGYVNRPTIQIEDYANGIVGNIYQIAGNASLNAFQGKICL